jgi:type III secretion system YscD/HrpQ family protein
MENLKITVDREMGWGTLMCVASGEEKGSGSPSFLVRLVAGPHAGAEAQLDSKDPRLVIGSGGEADLILADALVEASHAEISIAGDKLAVKSLGGKIYVGGHLIGADAVDLQPFQFVTIGTTQLVTGPSAGKWPTIDPADAPPLETLAAEVPDEAMGEVQEKMDPKDLLAARDEAKRLQKKSRRKKVVLASAVALLALFIGLLLVPEKKKLNLGDVQKILQAQVADMNYFPGVIVTLESNQLIVDGYVGSNEDLRELRSTLMATYAGIQYRVRSEEKIIEAIEETLHAVENNLRVVRLQAGIYSIVGYVYNMDLWQRARDRISTEIPGVKKIQNDVMTPDRVSTLALATLNQYGIAPFVTVTPESRHIVFRGKLSVLHLEPWRRAAEDFIQTFANLVPLEFDVQTSSAQTETANNAFFPAPIQSITISSSGLCWVATTDGKKYFRGSFLASGWRVDDIAIGGLQLSRDGNRVIMHLEALQ